MSTMVKPGLGVCSPKPESINPRNDFNQLYPLDNVVHRTRGFSAFLALRLYSFKHWFTLPKKQIMQTLQISQFFPLSLLSKTHVKPSEYNPQTPNFSLLFSSFSSSFSFLRKPPKAYASDEFPVDETFLEQFGPKDTETEDEARKRNWVERGWAPWEEILSPEADFARKSLNEGEEVPLKSPETIEAFKMLKPSYRKKKTKELGLTEDEYYAKQFEIKGEILDPLETYWDGPLVVRHVAPRDWPPRGWKVDRKELEFIREAHKTMAQRVTTEELDNVVREKEGMCLDRYKVFLKQYQEWVEFNKDKLEEESYKVVLSISFFA